MKYDIGIDVGGTKILAVVLEAGNKILARSKSNIVTGVSPEQACAQIKGTAEKALKEAGIKWEEIAHLGVAIPSSVDPATGEAFFSPALGWKNIPIKKMMTEVFKRELVIENDVNCGVLAEHRIGAAKTFKNVAGFFVGTGLGGALIINGQLYRGTRGLAGEFGHETIKYNGRKCGCGKRGCTEAYCSKTAFAKKLRKLIERGKIKTLFPDFVKSNFSVLKSRELAAACKEGNKSVEKILDKGFYMLGLASANIVILFDPECIVYGGGVVEALGDRVITPIMQGFSNNIFGLKASDICLVLSELGDDAVPIGAALNARERMPFT
jgi:glucokinase